MNANEETYFTTWSAFDSGRHRSAFRLAARGAGTDNIPCCGLLGFFYDTGYGTRRDAAKALMWYKKEWRFAPRGGLCCNIASLLAAQGNARRAVYRWRLAVRRFQDGDAALELADFFTATPPAAARRNPPPHLVCRRLRPHHRSRARNSRTPVGTEPIKDNP